MQNVIPRDSGVLCRYALLPLFPRQETQPGVPIEPPCNTLRIPSQRDGRARNRVKRMPDGHVAALKRQEKCLRHILRMNVMNSLHPGIRKHKFRSTHERCKNLGVEVPGRIDRRPSRTDQMARMNHGDRKTSFRSLLKEPCFDSSFPNAVVAKRMARLVLGCGNGAAVSMHPYRSAMEQVCCAATKSIRQLLRALQVITREVDYCVGLGLSYSFSERVSLFLRRTVEAKIVNRVPRRVSAIRLPHFATDTRNRIARLGQHGRQVASDMPGSANDNYAHFLYPFTTASALPWRLPESL